MDTPQFAALFTLLSAIYFRVVAIYWAIKLDDGPAEVISVLSILIFVAAFGLFVFSVIFPWMTN